MKLPPQSFATLCQVAGLPEVKAQAKWKKMWEKIVFDYLKFLVKKAALDESQLKKLGQILSKVNSGKIKNKNFLDLTLPILGDHQRGAAIDEFGLILVKRLNETYREVKNLLVLEQKQVWDAYVQARLKHG